MDKEREGGALCPNRPPRDNDVKTRGIGVSVIAVEIREAAIGWRAQSEQRVLLESPLVSTPQ